MVAYGTYLGIATIARSTKGYTVDMLHDASRWFTGHAAIRAANRGAIG